jgi:RNA polymerase sigma-70 factor (ECF subfamily)
MTAAEVVRKYRTDMLSLASRISGPHVDPEDVVQDASIAILQSIPTYRGSSSLKTWALGVVVRCAAMARRRECYSHGWSRSSRPGMPCMVAEHRVPDVLARERILRGKLTPLRADVLVRFAYGETVAETAAALGIPARTVLTRRFYAVAALRKQLRVA